MIKEYNAGIGEAGLRIKVNTEYRRLGSDQAHAGTHRHKIVLMNGEPNSYYARATFFAAPRVA